MKYIFKKIFLYFNYIFNFYNISTFFIKTIVISIILTSFSVAFENRQNFFNQFLIKKNNKQENYILQKQNQKIHTLVLKNYSTVTNQSNLAPYLSNNIIKKIIFIKKNSNFFRTAYESGLNLSDIQTIIKAIEWQTSFQKLNVNSSFHLIFYKTKENLKKNKNTLLGIKLNNLNKTYYAIRALNGNFYDLNGCNKSKIIMDFSLLKKYRISSHFDLHRFHPITHHISPHLGIDLAMPKGTAVLATSNGKVIKTAFNSISGFYIVLSNQNQCITKYMHLEKILVKTGQNIKINQKIALSGSTGRTTGPHLHYEIWLNEHPINPMYAQSNFIEQLAKKEKILFFKISKIILSKLK